MTSPLFGVAVYRPQSGEMCVMCEDALSVMSPDFDIFTTREERMEQTRDAVAFAVRRNRLVLCESHETALRDTIAGYNALISYHEAAISTEGGA